jgi:hypothetical protein
MNLEAGLKATIIEGSPLETMQVGEDILEVYYRE